MGSTDYRIQTNLNAGVLDEVRDWPSDPWPKSEIGKLLATLGKPGDPIPEPVRIDFDLMEVVPADYFEEPAVPVVVEG